MNLPQIRGETKGRGAQVRGGLLMILAALGGHQGFSQVWAQQSPFLLPPSIQAREAQAGYVAPAHPASSSRLLPIGNPPSVRIPPDFQVWPPTGTSQGGFGSASVPTPHVIPPTTGLSETASPGGPMPSQTPPVSSEPTEPSQTTTPDNLQDDEGLARIFGNAGADAATNANNNFGADAAANANAGTGAGANLGRAEASIPLIGDQSPFYAARLFARSPQFVNGRGQLEPAALRANPNTRAAQRFPGLPSPLPFPNRPTPPEPPTPLNLDQAQTTAALLVRQTALKIADHQTPKPTDRIYFSYNVFNNFNDQFNRANRVPAFNLDVHHYLFGLEKTFLDEFASLGLRLPYNAITYRDNVGNRQSFQGLGNLAVYGKLLIVEDLATDNALTLGLVINTPSGPTRFAGSRLFTAPNATSLQPFAAVLYNFGTSGLFYQGITAIDVPLDNSDLPIMLFQDSTFGYRLFSGGEGLLTAVTPVFETHVNIPLNNRGFAFDNLLATPDVVNLTFGVHVELARRLTISTAYIQPVTGPRIFDYEVAVLASLDFGGRRAPAPQPSFGGLGR